MYTICILYTNIQYKLDILTLKSQKAKLWYLQYLQITYKPVIQALDAGSCWSTSKKTRGLLQTLLNCLPPVGVDKQEGVEGGWNPIIWIQALAVQVDHQCWMLQIYYKTCLEKLARREHWCWASVLQRQKRRVASSKWNSRPVLGLFRAGKRYSGVGKGGMGERSALEEMVPASAGSYALRRLQLSRVKQVQ